MAGYHHHSRAVWAICRYECCGVKTVLKATLSLSRSPEREEKGPWPRHEQRVVHLLLTGIYSKKGKKWASLQPLENASSPCLPYTCLWLHFSPFCPSFSPVSILLHPPPACTLKVWCRPPTKDGVDLQLAVGLNVFTTPSPTNPQETRQRRGLTTGYLWSLDPATSISSLLPWHT